MKIAKVIEKADRWQPNVFSLEDKLDWCYEVTRDILVDNPRYLSVTREIAVDGGVAPLPEGVSFSDVAEVYVNGKRQVRKDERTLEDMAFQKGDMVYIVYRVVPKAYAPEGEQVPEDLETVCDAPFDSMYIDYVCAQIAFQQNDVDEYNKFISSYNSKFYAYKNVCGANSPISARKDFVNWF